MLSPETQSEVRAAIDQGRTLLQRIAAAAPELASLYSMTFADIVAFPGGSKVHGAYVRDRSAAFLAELRAFDELVRTRDPVTVLASAVAPDDEGALGALRSAKEAEAFIRSVLQLLAGATEERAGELLGTDLPGQGGEVAADGGLLAAIDWAGLLETLEGHRMLVYGVTSAAFDAYSAAMGDAIATGQFSAAGIGKALRMSAKESLMSIGRRALAMGMFELGTSLKSFAHGDNEGGQKHLGVAGKYMAVVAMTGAAAGAMGGAGGRGGGKKKGDDEVAPAGAAPSGTSSSKPKVIQHLRIIGNPTDDDIESTKKHYRN